MSIEAYKIAVKVSLVENVTRGLQMMARHFKSTDADAKALEARLKSIGKMAAIGGIMTGAGLGGLALFKGPLEEAKKYEILLGRLQQFGMGDVAMRDAQKFVEAQHIMGASQRDMLRYFIEAQGVFRESGAKTVPEQLSAAKMAAPMMARMTFASRGLDERSREATETKTMDMLRFVEQAGGLRSPRRFGELLDAGFRAVQSSGGNVDFTQYRQFMARGGSSALSLSNLSLFADLEPIIGEMKGSTAGNALMTAFNRMNGIVRVPNQIAHELVKNGLWDGSKIIWNNQGGIKQFTGNPMVNAQQFGSDPVDYYRNQVLPMYARMGIDPQQRVIENAKIFGRTGGAMFNLIDKQLPTILRSREAFNRSRGIDQSYRAAGGRASGKEFDLEKREADLKLKIGQVILPYYVKGLEMALAVMNRLNAFITANPTFTKIAVGGFALVSVAAVVGGSLTLLTAGLRGLLLIRNLVPAFRAVGVGLSILRGGLGYLPMLFRYVVAALGPVGLAIAAIATVGWLVYNNWKEINSALFANFKDIGDAVRKLFNGDIMGAIGLFGRALLRSFQTVLNTVIAGLNSMTGLGIAKFTFADPEQPAGSKFVAPAADKVFQATNNVYLDGYRIAMAVTKHQAKEAARPNAGSTGFDGQRARPSHALGAIR
mgnify:CR=1 FL=1